MRNKQSGFTIVELVVVIILLGILAATALPRFMDVDQQAHAAAVEGVLGGLQTAVGLYHAQYIADGTPSAGTAITEFGSLRTNAAGYPYGLTDTATDVVATSGECGEIFQGVLQGGPTISTVAALANVAGSTTEFTTHVSGTNCVYYYTAQGNVVGDTIPTLTYNSTTGVFTQSTATLT